MVKNSGESPHRLTALMAGRRVLVPGLGNQLQIFMARFLPRRLVVKGAEAMLQRTR